MIQPERIKELNNRPIADRRYIVYWMQQAQRSEYNHALEYAIQMANDLNKPIVTYFGITDNFPDANQRHYYFMLEGLRKTQKSLAARGIQLVIQHESPEIGAARISQHACLVVTDRGYLKLQREWRSHVAQEAPCKVTQVETDVVVPVETASSKEEYAAATIRRKIHANMSTFLRPIQTIKVKNKSLHLKFRQFSIEDIDAAMRHLKIDRSVPITDQYQGGTDTAKKLLDDFINRKLRLFATQRNDPTKDRLSSLSPYLHFGQISPLYIALQVNALKRVSKEAFLEELIVRRELSMNFIYYNPYYESFKGLPRWARESLAAHRKDRRPYSYSRAEMEAAKTHDPYWNAAQTEMVIFGKMHGYMRMYWGKKIIEWTREPEEAFNTALYLNNKYELDGRDPNGYTGVAWCFGKHDRPWPERKIFGKVRYMNAAGLERKFEMNEYVSRILKTD